MTKEEFIVLNKYVIKHAAPGMSAEDLQRLSTDVSGQSVLPRPSRAQEIKSLPNTEEVMDPDLIPGISSALPVPVNSDMARRKAVLRALRDIENRAVYY